MAARASALRRVPGRRSILALLLLAATPCFAQEGQADQPDYSFEMSEDGMPLFTQHLRWDGNPDALRYEFVLYDETGAEIDRKATTETHLDLRLKPGKYRYEIVIYNLLDQAEASSERAELDVERAEMPSIRSFSPRKIDMDEGKPAVVTIDGDFLMPGAEVELLDQAKGSKKNVRGTVVSQEGTETTVVEFPSEELQFGRYRIKVLNPGGLTRETEKDITVRYQKPADFYASADYGPTIPLYGSFYKETWPDAIYPLSLSARAGLYFLKRRVVFLGAELQGTLLRRDGGTSAATLRTTDKTLGGNLVAAFRLGKAFRLVCGIGGGANLVSLEFDYDGASGDSMESIDPFARAGLAVQWFFAKHAYAALGGDWTNVFRNGYTEGKASPSAAVGLYF